VSVASGPTHDVSFLIDGAGGFHFVFSDDLGGHYFYKTGATWQDEKISGDTLCDGGMALDAANDPYVVATGSPPLLDHRSNGMWTSNPLGFVDGTCAVLMPDVGGLPAVAYVDPTTKSLMFIREGVAGSSPEIAASSIGYSAYRGDGNGLFFIADVLHGAVNLHERTASGWLPSTVALLAPGPAQAASTVGLAIGNDGRPRVCYSDGSMLSCAQ
jgi:hypothetical protein